MWTVTLSVSETVVSLVIVVVLGPSSVIVSGSPVGLKKSRGGWTVVVKTPTVPVGKESIIRLFVWGKSVPRLKIESPEVSLVRTGMIKVPESVTGGRTLFPSWVTRPVFDGEGAGLTDRGGFDVVLHVRVVT